MNHKTKSIVLTTFLFVACNLILSAGKVYQVGTVQALLKGLYQPTVTVAEAKQNADTGLGCGVGIGELIAIDGDFYIADGNGNISKLSDNDRIPFFQVQN